MKNDDLISVIVPTYNAQPYLAQAIQSILDQTHENLEVLCINDGSTDDSLDTMRAFAEMDPRIRVIDKQNQGYGATCNRGLDEARGTWVAILEPDDWIESGMFEAMLSFARTFDEPLDIVKTPYWRIFMPGKKAERKLNCGYRRKIKPQAQPFKIHDATLLLREHPSIWSALYRKSFLEEKGIRFPEIPGAGWADNPFLIDTLCQADRIGYLDEPFYCYREETPEKAVAFAESNTFIPFYRWHDMCDELERLNVTDPDIWEAHYCRGFLYLSGVIEVISLENEDVFTEAVRMFDRMDADAVLASKIISPGSKKLFARLRMLPEPNVDNLAYLRKLIGNGLYNLRNTDIRFTAYSVVQYFKRHGKRVGHE